MPTLYRYIKYEFENQADLDTQMNKSLAEGIHQAPITGTITVRDSIENKCGMGFFEEVKSTGVQGCITKEQLEKRKQATLEENARKD